MTSLNALYSDLIKKEAANPANFGEMQGADGQSQVSNPICGDRIEVFVKLGVDKITRASFTGRGCSICLASASIMTKLSQGVMVADFYGWYRQLPDFLLGFDQTFGSCAEEALKLFQPVQNFPARRGCVTLPWQAMKQAIVLGQERGGDVNR